jgi:hypothetical protein
VTGKEVLSQRAEWNRCYKAFVHQYLKTTHSFIPDLRYDKEQRCYIGLAEWQHTVAGVDNTESRTITNHQEVKLSRPFVKNHFPKNVLAYVRQACNTAQGRFFPVPKPVPMLLDTRVVTHVKCIPAQGEGIAESFHVKYANHDMEVMAELQLQQMFGIEFLGIVRHFAARGFINIPPGNANHHIERAPVQTVASALLRIKYPQGETASCVLSSVASALHCMGWEGISLRIADEIRSTMHHPHILSHLTEVMATEFWLQPCRLKRAASFDLLAADLKTTLAVVVLKASDGSTGHAISVHDSMIFDSNEPTALPLCQANLDYICSTSTQKAVFVGISAGVLFKDQTGTRIEIQKTQMAEDQWQRRVIKHY